MNYKKTADTSFKFINLLDASFLKDLALLSFFKNSFTKAKKKIFITIFADCYFCLIDYLRDLLSKA